MNIGDLVKFRNPKMHVGKTFLVTHVRCSGSHISLMGFPENQVFKTCTLEVIDD